MDCDSISFQPAIQLMGTPFDFCIILTFISEGYNWNKYSRLDLDCWIFSCYGLNLFDFHCQRFGYITCQNESVNISTPRQNSPISEYILNPLICQRVGLIVDISMVHYRVLSSPPILKLCITLRILYFVFKP